MTTDIRLPVKFFIDSVDYAWDRVGTLFIAVQTNDTHHVAGSAVYKQQPNGSFVEVLATGPLGWGKCKMKMRYDGTGWLVGAGQDLTIHMWQIPEWRTS
jgi:hypothetical protein